MAVITLKSLVLRSVAVARAVKAGLVGVGAGNQSDGQAPVRLSYPRLVSQHARTDAMHLSAHDPAEPIGETVAAGRAGRPGSGPRVPFSPRPASRTGRTVQLGQSTALCTWLTAPRSTANQGRKRGQAAPAWLYRAGATSLLAARGLGA
jgi:hypothetical protein